MRMGIRLQLSWLADDDGRGYFFLTFVAWRVQGGLTPL
jgi:hypothetical protein